MEGDTPQLNPLLANGLATTQMKDVDRYIDGIIRAAARNVDDRLVYRGIAPCTPLEEYMELIRRRSTVRHMRKGSRKVYETARTNASMMKVMFDFDGVPLQPRYVFTPYVGMAGSYVANGVEFNIVPVIADRVLQIDTKSIFVRFFCDRVTFHRTPYAFQSGGVSQIDKDYESVKMVHSLIHHNNAKAQNQSSSVSAVTSMAHYLFCKFGLLETFRKYANGCVPVVTYDVDPLKYPDADWVICQSTGNCPSGYKATPKRMYVGPRVKICIPRSQYTNMVKALVTGFFYVADHFPNQVVPEYVHDPRQWMILMGHMLFSSDTGVGRLQDSMQSHLASLDEYVDIITKNNMKEVGVEVDTIYDFFGILIDQFSNWIHEGSDKINSMYDKELSVLYFVMFDLIKSIFSFNFAITSAAKKGLVLKTVEELLDKHFNPRLIQYIRKTHGELVSNSYPGDNMAFGITTQLTPQDKSTKGPNRRGGERGAANDPRKRIHVSVAEIGAYTGMGKNEPSGRNRINLNAMLSPRFVTMRNPKFVDLLTEVQAGLPNN